MRFAALLIAGLVLSACSSSPGTTSRSTAPARTTPGLTTAVPTTAGPTTAVTRTVLHTFAAYRSDGRPAVPSTRTQDGYCWDSSLAAAGPTAFRCFSAGGDSGQILDPCFAPATGTPTTVLCVDDPWSRATTLHLTRALPAPVSGEAERPWAIQLADGARCVASTGTVPTVGGVNLSYHCSDRTAAALAQVGTPAWTAVDADPAATTLRHTIVTAAWRT